MTQSAAPKNASPGVPGPPASARRRFIISQREPWQLPADEIELPAPRPLPGTPPTINWFMTILPGAGMLIMMVITLVIGYATGSAALSITSIPMLFMSLIFPLATLGSYFSQKKKYDRSIRAREAEYGKVLRQEEGRLTALVQDQRNILAREYPALEGLVRIAVRDPDRRQRLWLRRRSDPDFLSLRIGLLRAGAASFKVSPPRIADQNDPLIKLPPRVIRKFAEIPNLPALLPLATAGSLAVAGANSAFLYGMTRRLLLEILVHHSPQDVQLFVLADGSGAAERWEWLKWAPHLRAFEPEETLRHLAFHSEAIDACLEWLSDEYNRRRVGVNPEQYTKHPAIVVVLDDNGGIRQLPALAQLAASGHEVGIYLLIAGLQGCPRECRARLEVSEESFRYVETWGGESGSSVLDGSPEPAGQPDCEQVARTLAGYEVIGVQSGAALPESIRISEALGVSLLDAEALRQRWTRPLGARDMLQFPVGVRVNRDSLEPIGLDLRPEDLGGKQAFHTVLIGTTGSGKSVFLQSLVLSAAYNYSPRHLNVLLMDFKAGASELSKLKELPHVVGLVTDLGPELAERALIAIESEIEHRKRIFEEAGKISDIWAYNKRFPEQPLPHLLLVLDEFAKGVELLPDMQRVLQLLATQGRALGMYLLLANQKVTGAVDALLANIGWRIVLRVSERDEMRIVDSTRPPSKRPGRGYIRVKEDVYEFQGSRTDQLVLSATSEAMDEFKIYAVDPSGKLETLYKHTVREAEKTGSAGPNLTELDAMIGLMQEAAADEDFAVRQIYLDPLGTDFSLDALLNEEPRVGRALKEGLWNGGQASGLVATLGRVDLPGDCRQERLQVHFEQQDGHLWIVGAPGSGKAMALTTVLLSLASTYTPQEAQFFILEYGSGSLRAFETLPHTGAVIRLPEQERMERLLNYLDAELERRTSISFEDAQMGSRDPALFVVVNNFAELRATYPDHADRFSRYSRDGKAANLHLIFATNRGLELPRMVSSNIARHLVLQMASRDELMDILGRPPGPLSAQAEGRGYWVDGGVVECQVAQPVIMPEPNTTTITDIRMIGQLMADSWKGPLPFQIKTLSACIPLDEMLQQVQLPSQPEAGPLLLVGQSHDSLQVITSDLLDELQHWLVLGPRQCGKSNFLACAAQAILQAERKDWEIAALALRRSPLVAFARGEKKIQCAASTEEAVKLCEQITARFEQGSPKKKLLILIDDLGAAFEPGKEALLQALNNFQLKTGSSTAYTLIASGMVDEIRLQQASPLVRSLRQSRTGIGFSKDPSELEWLGYQIPLSFRKLEMPPGRGFWVSKGKALLVQSPWMGTCGKEK
ncbi:MAG: hypothetical protein JXB85_01215 [Anaerolineales bacterium]|nr:hypothetical protein [Anaerolineales bacterium]